MPWEQQTGFVPALTILARYLHIKKPLPLFARRTYTKKREEWPTLRPETLVALCPPPLDFSNQDTGTVFGIDLQQQYVSAALRMRFPVGTGKGFLYYQPGSTELSGQLRLRLCDDASSFDAGRDLFINNQPWGIDLVNLVRRPRCQKLVETIVKDGFVSPQTIDNMRAHLADTGVHTWRNILCALSDLFYVRLDHPISRLRIVSEHHNMEYWLNYTFITRSMHRDQLNSTPESAIMPFTGTLKVRFELSKLPEHASLGPTLVLKILEVHDLCRTFFPYTLRDLKVEEPVEGEYYYWTPSGKSEMWRFCIDEIEGAREAFGPLLDLPGIVYAE